MIKIMYVGLAQGNTIKVTICSVTIMVVGKHIYNGKKILCLVATSGHNCVYGDFHSTG